MDTRQDSQAEAEKVVFVFSPQGGQWRGMGRHFYRDDPVFRLKIAECDAEVRRHLGWSFLDDFVSDIAGPEPIADNERIQPTVTALQIALAELLAFRGIYPAAVVGLSMGELAAAVSAGVLPLGEAMRIACCEAKLTREKITSGCMALVPLSALAVRDILAEFNGRICVAIDLSPNINVISGEEAAMASAIAKLKGSGIRCRLLRMGFAFHSPLVLSLREKFLGPLQVVNPEAGCLPIYSSVTGNSQEGERFNHDYWWRIVHEPASFRSAIEAALSDGYRMFVEIGPHPVLLQAIHDTARVSQKEIVALSLMKRNDDGAAELRRLAAKLLGGR